MTSLEQLFNDAVNSPSKRHVFLRQVDKTAMQKYVSTLHYDGKKGCANMSTRKNYMDGKCTIAVHQAAFDTQWPTQKSPTIEYFFSTLFDHEAIHAQDIVEHGSLPPPFPRTFIPFYHCKALRKYMPTSLGEQAMSMWHEHMQQRYDMEIRAYSYQISNPHNRKLATAFLDAKKELLERYMHIKTIPAITNIRQFFVHLDYSLWLLQT